MHDEEEHLVGVVLRCHAALDAWDLGRLERLATAGLLAEVRAAWVGRRRMGAPSLRVPDVRVMGVNQTRCVVELRFSGGVDPLTGFGRGAGEIAWWTLRRDEGRWKLAAFTRDALDDGLAAEAAFELAAADGAPDAALEDRLTRAADVRVALQDLALLDERFAWHVLEHVVSRVAAAWTDARQLGRPDPLLVHASAEATDALLRLPHAPTGEITPLAVRGGRVLLGVGGMRFKLVADATRPGGWRLDAAYARAPSS